MGSRFSNFFRRTNSSSPRTKPSWPRFREASPPDQKALDRLREHPDLDHYRRHLLLLRDQALARLLVDPCQRWADQVNYVMEQYEWLQPSQEVDNEEETE